MRFDILTLFPDLFSPLLEEGVLGRAVGRGLLDIRLTNIREFTEDRHKTTDDRPYGGGEGMVMKPEPIARALESVERIKGRSRVILLSPQGEVFSQSMAWELSRMDQLILICGRYEGVDERVRTLCCDMELSIGDYILSGGETAALVVMDAVMRLLPGVLGSEDSVAEESFMDGLLDYPQYTRPDELDGMSVPDVLLEGNHELIRRWRLKQALGRTWLRRPELLENRKLSAEEQQLLQEFKAEQDAESERKQTG